MYIDTKLNDAMKYGANLFTDFHNDAPQARVVNGDISN